MKTPLSLLLTALCVLPASAQTVQRWGSDGTAVAAVPSGLLAPKAVTAGTLHSAALLADGTVSVWGSSLVGILDVPAGLASVRQLEATFYSTFALKSDGTVVSWGDNYWTQRDIPTYVTGVQRLYAGGDHCYAMTNEGWLYGWGSNTHGQLNVPAGLQRRALMLAGGGQHQLALRDDGVVLAWGNNDSGQCNVPATLGTCKSIAASYKHSLGLKTNGTVVAWGLNGSGQCNVPAGLTNVVAISAGYWHSSALKSDGTVVTWGDTSSAAAPTPSDIANVAMLDSAGGHNVVLVSQTGVKPRIVSPTWAYTTTTATAFHYQAAAANFPTSWSTAAPLPTGLTLNASTGVLSGQIGSDSQNTINLRATNAHGTDEISLVLRVKAVAATPLEEGWEAPMFHITPPSTARMSVDLTESYNGNDSLLIDNIRCQETGFDSPWGYWCKGSPSFNIQTLGPARITFWTKCYNDGPCSISSSSTGLADSNSTSWQSSYSDIWVPHSVDIGPGYHSTTIAPTAIIEGELSIRDYLPSYIYMDNLVLTPLPSIPVATSLAGTSLIWTQSPANTWQGKAKGTDGLTYAYMIQPPTLGSTASLTTSVTGPSRVHWKWYNEARSGNLELLMNGAPVASFGTNYGWQERHLDVIEGTHELTWRGTSPHTGAPVVAAVSEVTVVPMPTFEEVLDSTGLTWTTGGASPWFANSLTQIQSHPTAGTSAASPAADGWLETTIAGPGILTGWCNGDLTIGVGTYAPATSNAGLFRLSVPAGSQTIRFTATSTANLDDIVFTPSATTPATLLGVSSGSLLETRANTAPFESGVATYKALDTVHFQAASTARPLRLTWSGTGSWTTTPAIHSSTGFALVPPNTDYIKLTAVNTAALSSHTIEECTLASLAEAWTSVHPTVPSDAQKVIGLGRLGAADPSLGVWLQADANLETTFAGPITVKFDALGGGSYMVGAAAAVNFPANSNWATTTLSFPAGSTTMRWAASSNLFLRNLVTTIPIPLSLETALETTGITPGGTGTWEAWDYPAWAAGLGTFARSPALTGTDTSWIEKTITGSFEFTYDASAGRLRLLSDGNLKADTQLSSGNGRIRMHVPGGATKTYRFLASGGTIQLGTISTTAITLAHVSAFAFPTEELAFWAESIYVRSGFVYGGIVPSGGFGYGNATGLAASSSAPWRGSDSSYYGSVGVFIPGKGRVRQKFGSYINSSDSIPQYIPRAPLTASNSLSPFTPGDSYESMPFNATLSLLQVDLACGSMAFPNPPWPYDYFRYSHSTEALAGPLQITWGNPEFIRWTETSFYEGQDRGPQADPDFDDMPNLMEYALGTDPTSKNHAPMTRRMNNGQLEVSIPDPASLVAGAVLTMETSNDLESWTPNPASAVLSTVNGVRTYLVPAGQRFSRFRVEIP